MLSTSQIRSTYISISALHTCLRRRPLALRVQQAYSPVHYAVDAVAVDGADRDAAQSLVHGVVHASPMPLGCGVSPLVMLVR